MAKRFGSIVLPLQILKQEEFAKKIQQIDLNISSNTLYLKTFIQKNHQICYQCNKQVNKLISSTEKKINSTNKEQQYFLKFLNNLIEINKCMQKQISKVTVVLNSKKHDEINRINEVINPKLEKAGESVGIFINMVREYNELDQRYVKKSEYYINFQNNPIKYYSLTKNQEKYQKIRKIQQELQFKLENISIFKGEIRDMMIELSVKISQLYENVRLKIEQLRKASETVLEKVVQIIKGFDKIQQVSQRAEQQSEYGEKQNSFTKPRDSLSGRKSIKQIKKEKTAEYEQQICFKVTILGFVTNFLQIIDLTVKQLTDSVNSKEFKKFYSEKAFMVQLLPPRSSQDIDAILEGQRSILNIYQGIQKILVKEVFEEIFKRQKLYFTRFIEQIDQLQDVDSSDGGRASTQKNMALMKDIREKQKKYCQEESQWKRELDLNLKDVMSRIRNQFLKKGRVETQRRADKKSDLFSQKQFEVLKLNYFEHKKVLGSFVRLEHVIEYEQLVKQNRLKNVMNDFEAQIAKNSKGSCNQIKTKTSRKIKISCCGIFRKLQKNDDQQINAIEKVKKNKQIDYYTCALKDGYMLYQGHITLYEDYLRFKSSFNPNTFFGSTDIIIPKFDICQFIRGRHIMSLLITVVTKRGSLQFTSFFSTDPFDLLVQVYMSNRNTQYEIATLRPAIDSQGSPLAALEELKLKMQRDFGQIAQKQQFKVTKVNVTDRLNQIQLEYLYIDETSQSPKSQYIIPLSFRVTIKQYENSLQYIFWHGPNQTLPRKKKLETIAKNLIKEDRVQKFDNITREVRERQRGNIMDDNISFNMGEQFSIIGGKEKHRIDVGFYDPIPPPDSTKSKKNVTVDWINLIQNQTKNNSNFFVPETHKTNTKKEIKNPQNLLKNLQSKEPLQKNVITKGQEIINKSLKYQSINFEGNKSLQRMKTDKSVLLSENASTVKLMDRKQKSQSSQTTHKKSSLSYEQDKQIRDEGTKNLLYLMALALGLIFILKLFV